MKVALVQLDTRPNNRESNLRRIEQITANVECDLVVLPEMFATGYNIEAEAVAEQTNGATLEWMKGFAKERGCAIAGTIATKERGDFFNRFYFCLPDGNHFHYDKRHLFTFAGEEQHFSAGKERVIIEWCGLRILPLVCYDLRFPAWSYLAGSVDVILYSASWAASRISAWDTLLPARAVENQAWVVGVNRVGIDHSGTPFCGHSVAYDCMGRKAVECGERECIEIVEIERGDIDTFRNKFRAWQDADQIVIR